ncbi:unnamed protein product, partial [marine sediment metagenome]
PLFKEYFKWLGNSLKTVFVQKPKALVKGILNYGSYISEKIKKGFKNLVLEFQTKTKELRELITKPWKRVPPKEPEKPILVEVTREEFEKLKQEIERIKKEGLPVKEIIKEVEVSRITKVEPIKEITKEIKILDDESLKRVRTTLLQQETEVEKLKLVASLGYVRFPTILSVSGDTTITTLGTISTGTWQGIPIADEYVTNDLTLASTKPASISVTDSNPTLTVSQSGTGYGAIITGGNVGIGTMGPGTLLTVRRTDAGNVFAIRNITNTGDTFTITDAGVVNLGTWQGTAVGTQYGGTGQNFSAIAQGSILYFSAAGTISNLAPGISGQYLKTQGADANPVWADVVGGGAPTDATYVTLSINATLTEERVLTAGTNISVTDGGVGGNVTIATINNPAFSTSVTSPIIYGSSAVSGNLTLRTTSDVTKGSYILSELTSDGFVKTTGGTGTLSIDTTSYQPAGTYVTSVTGTSPITSSGGTTPDIGITQTLITNLNSALATGLLKITTTTGLLSTAVAGTDYQAAGDYITALTGEVTATGPGSVAATIASQTSATWLGKVS